MTASISSLTQTASLLGWAPADATATAGTPTTRSAVQNGVFAAVSTKLGISQSDLTTQLKAGKSMTDVATAAGVSTSDLTATIQDALAGSGLPAGVNLATMATRMAGNVNNSSIADAPATSTATTSTAAASVPGAAGSTSLGIDTSTVREVNLGGLLLDSGEVSTLLGNSGGTVNTYL